MKTYIESNHLNQIFSIGSGRANFEYHLYKTKVPTTISDFSKTIKKIEKFKIFEEVKIINAKEKFKIQKQRDFGYTL